MPPCKKSRRPLSRKLLRETTRNASLRRADHEPPGNDKKMADRKMPGNSNEDLPLLSFSCRQFSCRSASCPLSPVPSHPCPLSLTYVSTSALPPPLRAAGDRSVCDTCNASAELHPMAVTETQSSPKGSLLQSIISDDTFRPAEPKTIDETGLTAALVENLIFKYVLLIGSAAGRQIADSVCLPFVLLEPIFQSLRQRQLLINCASAQLGDFVYTLTDQGRQRARSVMEQCAYLGAAPVPLDDYIVSVEAQTIRAEAPQKRHLQKAFADISVEPDMFDMLGPAVNSGAGLFLYGAPGNGKTTLAKRITMCYGSSIWIPKTLTEDGQFIKLFDAACHEPLESN